MRAGGWDTCGESGAAGDAPRRATRATERRRMAVCRADLAWLLLAERKRLRPAWRRSEVTQEAALVLGSCTGGWQVVTQVPGAPVTLHVARGHVCSARLLFYISARDDGLVLRFRRRSTRHARGPRSPPVSKLKLERPHALRASGWRRAPHAQYHASHACAGPRDRVVCGPPPSSSRSCSRPRWHCTQTAAHAPADTMHAISAVPSAGVESRQSEAGSRQSATISRFAAS